MKTWRRVSYSGGSGGRSARGLLRLPVAWAFVARRRGERISAGNKIKSGGARGGGEYNYGWHVVIGACAALCRQQAGISLILAAAQKASIAQNGRALKTISAGARRANSGAENRGTSACAANEYGVEGCDIKRASRHINASIPEPRSEENARSRRDFQRRRKNISSSNILWLYRKAALSVRKT
jgi:hypothetical protein